MSQNKFKRRVFYIHGFDPRGARSYHNEMKMQASLYQQRHGVEISISPRKRLDTYAIDWMIETDLCSTQYTYLSWDDIVMKRLRRPFWVTFWQGTKTFFTWVSKGLFWHWLRENLTMGMMVIYCFLMAIFLILATMAGVAGIFWLVSQWVELPVAVYFLGCFVAVPAVLLASRKYDGHFYIWYLFQDFSFIHREAIGLEPEPIERVKWFADYLDKELTNNDAGEVLIVAHSTGVYQAGRALALYLENADAQAPAISFLTIGQNVSLYAWYKNAHELLKAFVQISANEKISWVDVSTPQDPLACPLMSLAVQGGAVQIEGAEKPKVLSARFNNLMPQAVRKTRMDWFNRHFLYLYANENVVGETVSGVGANDTSQQSGDYDWFMILTGALTLQQRFANRKSSKGLK